MFGEEAIDGMKTGIALIMLSLVLSLGVVNIIDGKAFITGYFTALDEKEHASAVNSFQDFMPDGKVVPVAAAYALINYNEDFVSEIHCSLNGHNNTFSDLS